MEIRVLAHTKSRKPRILEREPGVFDVYVKELPEGGKANEAIAKALAAYLGIPKSSVELLRGAASKTKLFYAPLHKNRK